MRRPIALLVLALALASPASADEASRQVTLFKDPLCGCCEAYAGYLRRNGFAVTTKPTHDLVAMSREAGIPESFEGCHLSFVDGYVVSGHVPVETVDRLLAEKPDIKGITMPGMPLGSPGMGGSKTEPFTIYQLGDGEPEVYVVE